MVDRPQGFFRKDVERIGRTVRAYERDGGEPVGGQSITRKPRGGSGGGWAKLAGDLKYGLTAKAKPAIGILGEGVLGDLHEFEWDEDVDNQIDVIDTKLLSSGKKFAVHSIIHWTSSFGKKVVDFSTTCMVNA